MEIRTEVELSRNLLEVIHNLPQKLQIKIMRNITLWTDRLKKIKGKKRAKYFYREIDKAVSEDTKSYSQVPGAKPITCKKGCSHCCYMNIDVFREEATLLAGKIRSGEISYNEPEFDAQKNMSCEDFHGNPRPCIFLKNNTCSIYEHRPSTCRKYFVVSDPKKCLIGDTPILVAKPTLYNAEIIYSAMNRASPFKKNSSLPYMLNQALLNRC